MREICIMSNQAISYWIKLILIAGYLATSNLYAANQAIVLDINQAIGPATVSYIQHGLQYAADQKAAVVIIRINTPGGLERALRGIDKAILASPVPVVSYVSPSGASAVSAGTFILYASAVAAMAPGTSVGTATPTHINAASPVKPSISVKNVIDEKNLSRLEHQVINDAAANIQSLALLHKRNAIWAELAVRYAVSLRAESALKLNVVNLIATDIPDLLHQLNKRSVMANGIMQQLQTDNLVITEVAPGWRYQFLSIITNPNIAYILLLIGIYGLFFEFCNRGMVVPGIIGFLSLLIALYGFKLLPINYVGIALLLLGFTFIAIEILISSFGILGLGGVIAFVTGSIFLLDVPIPGYHIAWSLIIMMAIFSIGFLLLATGISVRAICKEIVCGSEALIGAEGTVLEYTTIKCRVSIHGEHWLAHSIFPLQTGQAVRVLKLTGLALTVEPITKQDKQIETQMEH
jgi:membrane-bound serine protease (ClpP class)